MSWIIDEEGTELNDLGAARREANRMVGMMLAQGEMSNDAWELFVADQSQTLSCGFLSPRSFGIQWTGRLDWPRRQPYVAGAIENRP